MARTRLLGDLSNLAKVVVARARELRSQASDAERRLWQRLRRRQLDGFRFRRQSPIGRYIVDFVCPERSLIVEVDGRHHVDQADRDAARTRWLQSQGYRVIRFWANDVLQSTEGVINVIRDSLRGGETVKCATPPP